LQETGFLTITISISDFIIIHLILLKILL